MARTRASKKSVHAHRFSAVPQAKIPRSSFDRSHAHTTSFDAGPLIPVFVDEALPGDTFSLRASLFGRLATPIKPLMSNLYLDSFFFFVPYRLVWDNWQKFNGEQTLPGDSTDFSIPQVTSDAFSTTEGSLWDYFGLPTNVTGLSVSALPFRAYRLIWNEWFRDQNLQNSASVLTGDGPDATDYQLISRGKRFDYFTGCLPWPQKGDPVTVPLGDFATVRTNATDVVSGNQSPMRYGSASTGTPSVAGRNLGISDTTAGDAATFAGPLSAGDPVYPLNLVADLSSATGFTINQLRQSFQIQKLLERDARGGTRYVEIIRSHFGVISPDARLQRPEFLGGSTSMVNIHPVQQTGATGADTSIISTPQGNLSGFGTVSGGGHGFTKSFTEHGIIIGLVNVRADLVYSQGVERMWSRVGRYDFYWPALAHIGEQAVLNKEIYADGTAADDNVFGYQERYAEYRYKPSRITNTFRHNWTSGSLDFWHTAEEFSSRPSLNGSFITSAPPIDRVIAVPDEPHFLLDCYFKLRCARPMPVYGTPGLIDHF